MTDESTSSSILEGSAAGSGNGPLSSENERIYFSLQPQYQALSESVLVPVNLDVVSVAYRVIGTWSRIQPFLPELESLNPPLDMARVGQLRAYALGLAESQSRYELAADPVSQFHALIEEGTQLRDHLRKSTEYLVSRGLLEAKALEQAQGPLGHKNLAMDLAGFSKAFRWNWEKVKNSTAVTREEVKRADALYVLILEGLGDRDVLEQRASKALDIRGRAFTLLKVTYDELRRGVAFLRWAPGELERLAPSLYAGRERSSARQEAAAQQVEEASAEESPSQAPDWNTLAQSVDLDGPFMN